MPRNAATPASQLRSAKHSLLAVYEQVSDYLAADNEAVAAITCALPVLDSYSRFCVDIWDWLGQTNDAWFGRTLNELRDTYERRSPRLKRSLTALGKRVGGRDSAVLWQFAELLLSTVSSNSRRSTGTYYTPPEIARYLLVRTAQLLRDRLGLEAGLMDRGLPGCILEPACGSGVFLAAAIKLCRAEPGWNELSARALMQRIIGIDISPVALFLCRLRIALLLCSSGITPGRDFPQPLLWCGNALAGPDLAPPLREPIAVVIGNPPFSSLSTNAQPWIQKLIRGENGHAGYFAIDGARLDEKKTWLHDDYVKFIRLAQWCIEQHGSGIVSLVTNHGWLDNATFRIARQQLLRTFDHIEIVDLHGNAKRHEASLSSERDENVFGIAQGIAVVTLTKTDNGRSSGVSRSDLWGSRATKLQQLSRAAEGEPLASQQIVPAAPWFAFAAPTTAVPREYSSAPLLTELMPVNSTVPVTARDHFVVARTREELLQRIDDLGNRSISDNELRARYFQRTRSQRYEPGDTRSWKLSEARRIVREAGDPQQFIRRCLYRPFVWRYVFWHPAMIDWPRPEVTRHLEPGNLALLARRQSIAGRECNFFWVTDCLPLDGVIRSDNRGSESFFPLWLYSDDGERRANIADNALQVGDTPEELFAYCYGLFHSREYRTRYVTGLAQEFPRILLPRDNGLFAMIAQFGKQLINLHLTDPLGKEDFKSQISDFKFEISDLNSQIESFHTGTYNVCRKWLQMENQTHDSPAFIRLQHLIAATIDIQNQIEAAIQRAGGFPAAFR